MNSNSNEDGSNKRRAQLGQWRTPPQPFFPNTTSSSSLASSSHNDSSNNMNTNPSSNLDALKIPIPPGVDPKDYAAFQEAYRRGAEAAAALAQPSHPQHAAAQQALFAAGFAAAQQQQQQQQIKPSMNTAVPQNVPSMMTANMPQDQQQQNTSEPKHMYTSLMAAPATSMPAGQNTSNPQQQKSSITLQPSVMRSNNNIPIQTTDHQNSQMHHSGMPMVGMQGTSPTAPSMSMNMNMNVNNNLQGSLAAGMGSNVGGVGGSRSISLPDMARYAARASAEDHKRKKRLARNRASARLRRLKKKNLVDTYEGEVGVLEASLAKLQAHSWGTDDDHEALLEALSMDRGQQPLPPERRQALIHDILKQQREQVQNIRDVHFEVMLLGWLANQNDGESKESNKEDQADKDTEMGNEEEEKLAMELNKILNLTPEQKEELKKVTETSHDEVKAIDTVDMCLEAMLNNSWIMNHPVEECTQQFMSILNPGQMSKFLLWTDHNSEAIDQLDYVNAPAATAPPAQSPTFVFGTDNEGALMHGDAGEGDEGK